MRVDQLLSMVLSFVNTHIYMLTVSNMFNTNRFMFWVLVEDIGRQIFHELTKLKGFNFNFGILLLNKNLLLFVTHTGKKITQG